MLKASSSFKIINLIKKSSIKFVVLILFLIFFTTNILFGFGYYSLGRKGCFSSDTFVAEEEKKFDNSNISINKDEYTVMDCIYFSFITATTIGYGDIYPTESFGKILVWLQSILNTFYVAIMMSIVTSKILWTPADTIYFSKKIVYNPQDESILVRIINTNSMPLINPEIRMTVTQHAVGDVIAGVCELDTTYAKPIYLGKHDYTLCISKESPFILEELKKALVYQYRNNKDDSRFRITITISGSNGIQSIAEIKKYYASDFVKGFGFKAIKYDNQDTGKYGMNYKKIQEFANQFEMIENEETIKFEE